MAFDLAGGAGEDVEAEILVQELTAEQMEHRQVPGQDERKEEREAEVEGRAETVRTPALDGGEEDCGEGQDDGGCAFGHDGDGEADPEGPPAVEVGVVDLRQAEESDDAAE